MKNLKKIRMAALVAVTVALVGCQTITDFATEFGGVALDRAQTISSALALRDGYLDLKAEVIENADAFTVEEQAQLEAERAHVEQFYESIMALSRGGSASQIVVRADDFLDTVLTVRASVDRAIMIIQPKIGVLNGDGALAVSNFISNYHRLSLQLDQLLARNNRAEAVQMAARLLKAAAPVIAGLLK